MNIVIDPKTFNETNLCFLDKKKNNIIDGYFSKIIYSSDLFIMNGVFLLLPFVIKSSPERGMRLGDDNTCIYDDKSGSENTLTPKKHDAGHAAGPTRETFLANTIAGDQINGIDTYTYPLQDNKHIIYFYTHHVVNLQYITILSEIENAIINMYKEINGIKKNNNLGLSKQSHKGYFKIYKERKYGLTTPQKKYMLKISGVWENSTEVGITYRFLEVFS